MNSSSTQFVTSGRMGFYEPIHQMSMWAETFKGNEIPNTSASMFLAGNPNTSASILMATDPKFDNQSEDTSHGTTLGPSSQYEQEASRPIDKIQRRQAQNREAARKSRLRKKAYVQQLETSRLKLIQVEHDLERARQQGLYVGGAAEASNTGCSPTTNPGIATFEMEYSLWLDVQNRHIRDLRTALNAHRSDVELRLLVDNSMSHYFELFRMKATAAKADVFYLMSGMWKTPVERFFLWIGGFHPSELIKILRSHLDPMTEQQHIQVCNLRQSCQQAEDALSQGMVKLQQTLAESVATGQLDKASRCMLQMERAMDKIGGLVRFVQQADHLRQETLQQMSRILTTHQAARGLLALGEYFQRVRDLSQLCANRPHEPA